MHSLGKQHIPGLGGSKSWHSELLLCRRRGANVEINSCSHVHNNRSHSLNRLFSWACIVHFNDFRRRWLGLWGAGPPTSATTASTTTTTTPKDMIQACIQWWECYVKVPGRLGGTSLGWRAGVLSVTQSVSNPLWWHQRDLPRHGSSNSSRYQQMRKLGIQHSGECQCIISQSLMAIYSRSNKSMWLFFCSLSIPDSSSLVMLSQLGDTISQHSLGIANPHHWWEAIRLTVQSKHCHKQVDSLDPRGHH